MKALLEEAVELLFRQPNVFSLEASDVRVDRRASDLNFFSEYDLLLYGEMLDYISFFPLGYVNERGDCSLAVKEYLIPKIASLIFL